jgi:Flp pilus assembly protein protease CpaA
MHFCRFLAVVCPVSSLTIRTIPNAQLAILLVWMIILISSTPIWLAHNLIAHTEGGILSETLFPYGKLGTPLFHYIEKGSKKVQL